MSTETSLYHIVVRNDRTKVDTRMTATPCTHAEACTIMRKMIPDTERPPHLRTLLVPHVADDVAGGVR